MSVSPPGESASPPPERPRRLESVPPTPLPGQPATRKSLVLGLLFTVVIIPRSSTDGWAVPDLVTADEFTAAARQAGFAHACLDDVTTNVRPSLRRLYRLALTLYPAGVVLLRPLRLITDKQLTNARSALEQYQALQRGLRFYGIFAAVPCENRKIPILHLSGASHLVNCLGQVPSAIVGS
jgi:hypothetical protein